MDGRYVKQDFITGKTQALHLTEGLVFLIPYATRFIELLISHPYQSNITIPVYLFPIRTSHLQDDKLKLYFPKEMFNMKRNLSTVDRVIRVMIAMLFAYLYFGGIVTGTLGIILVVLGAVFLLTSIIAFCPLYLPFKFSTYKA